MTHPNNPTRPQPMNTVGSRMSLANITRGKQPRPMRAVLYGVEGVGKSTFAAGAPSPIFLCSEDGTAHIDVARFPTPRSWPEVLEAIRVLTHEEHSFKTLVIDTLDWLEPVVWAHVCQTGGKVNIEEFGYGKGYVLALDQWRLLLSRVDLLVKTRKVHVLMLAHASIKRVDDPQTGPFDRYRMKLHDKSADVLREWADAVLFARHEVFAVERKGKTRGTSTGARVIHTQWTAAFDAKNRFDLPETLPLDWDEFERAAELRAPRDAGRLRAELEELALRLPADRREKLEKAMREWAGDNAARLAQLLDKARGTVALAQAESAEEGGAA